MSSKVVLHQHERSRLWFVTLLSQKAKPRVAPLCAWVTEEQATPVYDGLVTLVTAYQEMPPKALLELVQQGGRGQAASEGYCVPPRLTPDEEQALWEAYIASF